MTLQKSPYKGTRDFFPEQMRLRNYIFSKMSEISETYAYEPYDGPLLEEIDLYRAKSGDELINEQVYKFIDRGDREVAIRPEMTPTLARMVAQIHREVSKPLRWYTIPNLMRYEKPQKGRLREFWQYNADIFGAPEGIGEIEVIKLAVDIMRSFGADHTQFEILINDRKFVDLVFSQILNLSPEENRKLYKLVDKKNKMPLEKFNAEINAVTQDEFKTSVFNEYADLGDLGSIKNFLQKYAPENQQVTLLTFLEKLDSLELSSFVRFDASIVRGLDYYTGIVFEIFDKHPDNRRAIAGGGAYANLLAIFGEQPLPGIGFGLGEVPLTEFLKSHKLLPSFSHQALDVLIGYLDAGAETFAFNLAQTLRDQKIKCELILGESKPKKIFAHGDKKLPTFLVMVGEEELKTKSIQIKNLKTKSAETISIDEMDKISRLIKGCN
jgi:histidyl-tRNA synthetase